MTRFIFLVEEYRPLSTGSVDEVRLHLSAHESPIEAMKQAKLLAKTGWSASWTTSENVIAAFNNSANARITITALPISAND